MPGLRERRYGSSLARSLAILGVFSPERSVLGIAEIAAELEMCRSTTHRYVVTLVALGYLEQERDRKYRLGLRVSDLGVSAVSATGLPSHTYPDLDELRLRTPHTASLGVLGGSDVLCVERVLGDRGRSANDELGSTLARVCRPTSRRRESCYSRISPVSVQQQLLAGVKQTPGVVVGKRALLKRRHWRANLYRRSSGVPQEPWARTLVLLLDALDVPYSQLMDGLPVPPRKRPTPLAGARGD
jgi:hypothetical protein